MGQDDDFATLLRHFRQRLSPATAGIAVTHPSRRRACGLRREELAEQAGVSTEHLRRLEQRRRHPSRGVVDALSRALRLTPAEYEQLSAAAGYSVTSHHATLVPQEITPQARRMLERLSEVPVAVCDAAWTVLAGNDRWNTYGCGAAAAHGRDRNMAWRMFTEAPSTIARSPGSSAAFKVALVADLRTAQRRYGDDPYLTALIGDLRRASADFERLWLAPEAVERDVDEVKVSRESGGHEELERDTLPVDGDLRVVVFTTPAPRADYDGSRSATVST